jgi:hypothetical protein
MPIHPLFIQYRVIMASLKLGEPISADITASIPYVRANGVSPVRVLIVVL